MFSKLKLHLELKQFKAYNPELEVSDKLKQIGLKNTFNSNPVEFKNKVVDISEIKQGTVVYCDNMFCHINSFHRNENGIRIETQYNKNYLFGFHLDRIYLEILTPWDKKTYLSSQVHFMN